MLYANLILATLLTASPALADATEFQGHTIESDGTAEARQVLRVHGTRYSIPGSPAQIVGKAQQCLSRKDSGAGVVSTDAAAGRLVAISRVQFGQEPLLRTLKGRLTVETGTGQFGIVLSNLGVLQEGAGDAGVEEVFSPVLQREGSGWQLALAALIGVERNLVDCMFS